MLAIASKVPKAPSRSSEGRKCRAKICVRYFLLEQILDAPPRQCAFHHPHRQSLSRLQSNLYWEHPVIAHLLDLSLVSLSSSITQNASIPLEGNGTLAASAVSSSGRLNNAVGAGIL
jgi:hypothetical protein